MKFLPATTILSYHRVTGASRDDPYFLCVTPENFESHLQALTTSTTVTTLDNIEKRASRRPQVIVTFDDGYVDNLDAVVPIAERYGVPFITYVTSGRVGKTFWWDRLITLMSGRDESEAAVSLQLGDGPLAICYRGPDRWQRAERALHERLRLLSPEQINEALELLEAALGEPRVESDARPLTLDELLEMSRHPLVTIGAHTADHQLLVGRSAASQFESISTSKSDLETMTGRPVRHFAYPYGGTKHIDANSVEAVERAGFATGCTSIEGHAVGFCNRYRLPRRIMMDWGPDEFAQQLRRWGLD